MISTIQPAGIQLIVKTALMVITGIRFVNGKFLSRQPLGNKSHLHFIPTSKILSHGPVQS